MNETSSNNPDGQKIFSGTKEVAATVSYTHLTLPTTPYV